MRFGKKGAGAVASITAAAALLACLVPVALADNGGGGSGEDGGGSGGGPTQTADVHWIYKDSWPATLDGMKTALSDAKVRLSSDLANGQNQFVNMNKTLSDAIDECQRSYTGEGNADCRLVAVGYVRLADGSFNGSYVSSNAKNRWEAQWKAEAKGDYTYQGQKYSTSTTWKDKLGTRSVDSLAQESIDSNPNASFRVIVLAQEEARTLQHNYIGTEHLLLGLIREGDGVAAKALASKGVTLDDTRKQVEEMIGKGNATPNGHIPFTPHARQVLELSLREALQLGHSYIGTEHILLGLIHEGEGVGTQVLIKMDVNLGELRSATIDLIRGNSGDGKGDGKGDLANAGGVQDRRNQTGSAILDQFGRNLTAEAAAGKLDPVIGRSSEIERVMVVLSRRTKNNPVLIGEPGVGKTAVVEGLAQKINAGDVPETLKGKQVYSLDLGSMVAGSRYRGDFEERLKKVLKEIKTRGDIVLFIDEIHTIVGAGSADGALGASDMLKPMLARGELQTIGATTTDEYRKYIEKDAALERRFQPIQVHEPSIAETIEILKGLRSRYENHHHVTITDGALQAAADLSSRYIQDRHLPDKAIDLIDEAGARLRIRRLTAPPELKELDTKIAKLAEEKDQAIKGQDFEKAAELRDKQEKLEAERKQKESSWREGESDVKMVVDEDVIAEVISQTTGIPVFKLTQAESKKLMTMESELHKRIIGQDEAVSALSRSIRRARVGLKDPKRPSGSFIFAGPTGVGKTELAKTLAEFLFDDEDALIRVDMSEFSEKYAASRLFGAPPGYVGYEEGGELTEKVRRKPFSVVLFDEIEKAHPDIFNTLLQVLDDGHLTDGQGRKVDFKNTIIILTTNLGTRDIAKAANTGFNLGANTESSYQRMKDQVSAELKQQFRPEFLNRLDDIIVFKQLTEPQVRQIVDLDVKQLNDRLFDRHMSLELTDAAKDLLAQKGFDPLLGARPLRRVIQRDVEDAISEKILMGELEDGQRVKVDAEGEGILGEFTFTGEAFEEPNTEPAEGEVAAETEAPAESTESTELTESAESVE